MNLDELLKTLKIDKAPVKNDNGSYTIEIDNSNEYSRYYTRLDKADFLELDEEASQINDETSSLQYINDEFVLTLLGDLESNTYSLIIREL